MRIHAVQLMNVEQCHAAADLRPSQLTWSPEPAIVYTLQCHFLRVYISLSRCTNPRYYDRHISGSFCLCHSVAH